VAGFDVAKHPGAAVRSFVTVAAALLRCEPSASSETTVSIKTNARGPL